jgi:hypothetical protein
MSVGSMQSDLMSGQTTSTVGPRSAGHCEPYSSDREADLISLSPPARAADSVESNGFQAAPPKSVWLGQRPLAGLTWPPPGVKDIRPGKGAAQGERLREARRKAAAEQGQGRAPAEHRPAWNAGPAARPPPRGRKPTQILPHPAPPLQVGP